MAPEKVDPVTELRKEARHWRAIADQVVAQSDRQDTLDHADALERRANELEKADREAC